MRAQLLHAAVVQHSEFVRVADSRKMMCHGEGSALPNGAKVVQCRLHLAEISTREISPANTYRVEHYQVIYTYFLALIIAGTGSINHTTQCQGSMDQLVATTKAFPCANGA